MTSDLVFGNLDNFIDKSADIFSTHQGFISGHFFYVRNIPFINNSFKLILGWRAAMISPEHHGINEGAWSNIFMRKSAKAKVMSAALRLVNVKYNIVDNELFTTPHTGIPWSDGTFDFPDYWIYENGKMTAGRKGPSCSSLHSFHELEARGEISPKECTRSHFGMELI